MKKKLLFTFMVILAVNSYAQISFEKGYFITNSNERFECLIKNIDWKNNPTSFKYKLLNSDEKKEVIIDDVMEFGIYNESKYIRSTVEIDKSSDHLDRLSTSRNPIFNKETLFLEVLTEGDANLYLYRKGMSKRFFYDIKNSDKKQLIHKRYVITLKSLGKQKRYKKEFASNVNNRYKQQLASNLRCSLITINDLHKLEYRKKDLIKYFAKYNSCNDTNQN